MAHLPAVLNCLCHAAGGGRATLITSSLGPISATPESVSAAFDASKHDVVYSAGNSLYPLWSPEAMVEAFPSLFAFGRGGPAEAREVAISFEQYVAHTMRLSLQTFNEHPDYILAYYDVLTKKQAFNSLSASMRVDPDLARNFGAVSLQELHTACNHARAVSESLQRGCTPPPTPGGRVGFANVLLRTLARSRQRLRGTFEHALLQRCGLPRPRSCTTRMPPLALCTPSRCGALSE